MNVHKPLLLTARGAAELLGVSRRRVYGLIGSGDFPADVVIRLGRAIRFSRPRLLAWLGSEESAEGPGGSETDGQSR